MKPDEARTLAGFLKGAFPNMTEEQVEVYESALLFEDAALASKAVLDGIREWKFPPRYAEIVERIRILRRDTAPAAVAYTPEEEVEFAKPIPFWVKRWVIARFICDPRDMRPFRESHPAGHLPPGDEEWMPEDAYVEEAKKLSEVTVKAAFQNFGALS